MIIINRVFVTVEKINKYKYELVADWTGSGGLESEAMWIWNGFDIIIVYDSMAVVGGEQQLQLIIVYFGFRIKLCISMSGNILQTYN